MIFDISLTICLVLLNGFFVAAEFAIVKVRNTQLELKIRTGSKLAKIGKNLTNHLDASLSATQLGITLASLGLGWIGEPVVSAIIQDIMLYFDVPLTDETARTIALPLAFVTITILHIVFGELAPKSLAIQRAEQVTLFIAIPLRLFYIIFSPFIWLLNSFANTFLKLIGFEPVSDEEQQHTQEEIRFLLEESSRRGLIETSDHELLDNVFEFSSTPIKQVMVPRGKICGIDISMCKEEIIAKFLEEGYSRMPVFEHTADNIIGVIYSKNLMELIINPDSISIQDIIRPPYFISEEDKINKVLRNMQKNRVHMAIILDEFGGTAGLVTMEDIIEEIFGEIQDEDDEETPMVIKLNDNDFWVDASTTIDDANDFLPLPLPESEDYETVGGLIINELGRIPEKNETIELDNYYCQILETTILHIEKVKLSTKKISEADE